jgi:hypothetical protein
MRFRSIFFESDYQGFRALLVWRKERACTKIGIIIAHAAF